MVEKKGEGEKERRRGGKEEVDEKLFLFFFFLLSFLRVLERGEEGGKGERKGVPQWS